MLAVAAPSELAHHLTELGLGEFLWPGTRLVALITDRSEGERSASPDLLSLFDQSGWAPEFPHRCDPLPGDARATAAWRYGEQVLVDRLGRVCIGVVLSKKAHIAQAERMTFVIAPARAPASGYFPLPADGHLPLPARLTDGQPFSATDLAASFGVPFRDALALIDELLASGAVSVVR